MTLRSVHAEKSPDSIAGSLDGSQRDVLAAMREALARKLDNGEISNNAIAAAYKELREVDRLIRSLDAEAEAEEARRADLNRERRTFNPAAI